jgi:hypothetical protein
MRHRFPLDAQAKTCVVFAARFALDGNPGMRSALQTRRSEYCSFRCTPEIFRLLPGKSVQRPVSHTWCAQITIPDCRRPGHCETSAGTAWSKLCQRGFEKMFYVKHLSAVYPALADPEWQDTPAIMAKRWQRMSDNRSVKGARKNGARVDLSPRAPAKCGFCPRFARTWSRERRRACGMRDQRARIHYGPGYRVYFHERGGAMIVKPCGGDKSSQATDIRTAKRLISEME